MLVAQSRPRNLRWFHAGPLLYGDWGTSRLYVLGLAFFYTAHASVLYLAAIGLLMLAVSWAYTIVCRSFPDGGGVYTAARRIHPTLSVIGATLLLSGYIMTAAISVVEAFHYFGVPRTLTLPLSVVMLVFIGAINWLGARSAGRFAMVVAFAALGVSAALLGLCLPFFIRGVETIDFSFFDTHSTSEIWISFTRICLALAGVEAVANMTGLMRSPVGRTAKRTIWPVTLEVVALNMVFGIALAGLDYSVAGSTLAETHAPHVDLLAGAEASGMSEADIERTEAEIDRYTDTAMKVIAERSGDSLFGPTTGFVLGKIAGVTFGLLLLSAANTAVMAMVSVLFAMAQDRELPRVFTRLNYSGVPWVGLIVAVAIPMGVVAVERDVAVLAELYVLGVCGAITVTVLSCAANRELEIPRLSRLGMTALGLFLAAVTLTIGVTEHVSAAFSGSLIALALISRFGLRVARGGPPEAEPIPEPATGWLAEATAEAPSIDPDKPKIMLAARGRYQAEFAVDLARRRGAVLFAMYVRTLRLMDVGAAQVPRIEEDPAAQEALGSVAMIGRANGVTVVPIYITSTEIAAEILDYTVTYGCDTLIMGKSRRPAFSRAIQGDVVSQVAASLPDEVALITRAADKPHKHGLKVPGPPPGSADEGAA